jgi:hypothetical protein
MWRGIEVWGTANAAQCTGTGLCPAQGVVELINGARLEHARTGIMLCKRDNVTDAPDFTFTGGIARVDNAVFYNCHRGISFEGYSNRTSYPSGSILANRSFVRNAEFIQEGLNRNGDATAFRG